MTREHIAGLAAALALLLGTDALAQSRTIYGGDGKVIGRESTGSNGSTTYYDSSGRVTARASTSSTSNQTTIYGADGRRTGTVTKSQTSR